MNEKEVNYHRFVRNGMMAAKRAVITIPGTEIHPDSWEVDCNLVMLKYHCTFYNDKLTMVVIYPN